jgi:branched-chain amino acid transport system permease protein
VWVLATAALSLLLLYVFFDRTILGKALRASSVNPVAARLMGIKIRRMALLAFTLSAGLSALAGIVIVPATFMTYDRGLTLSLKGFVAAVMGDLTSVPMAVVGGLFLGVIETLGAGLISSGYKDAISFVVLIVVLLFRFGNLRRGQLRAEGAGL